MSERIDEVTQEALSLSPLERMQLIDRLYDSIRPGHERAIEREWAAESERRIDAYERGEADTISYEEMKRELREREG